MLSIFQIFQLAPICLRESPYDCIIEGNRGSKVDVVIQLGPGLTDAFGLLGL